MPDEHQASVGAPARLIAVAALGYFVDVFDIQLFSMIRVPSLRSIGVPEERLLSDGVWLLNLQMAGMLFGGFVWGVIGDACGRVRVLLGSIFVYSLATLLNAFVSSVEMYGALRFIAGAGLAGEIGAGIALVVESMPATSRGYGTTLVATIGVAGAVMASIAAELLDWRTAYVTGGVAGFVLLGLRISVHESSMFMRAKSEGRATLMSFRAILRSWRTASTFVCCVFAGAPIYFGAVVAVLLAPELGKALSISEPLVSARAGLSFNIGIVFGDLSSGLLSQWWKTRKRVLLLFTSAGAILSAALLTTDTAESFYLLCFPLGVALGSWAVFLTTCGEQFGTNVRATVTTTVPSIVRALTIPMTIAFTALARDNGAVTAAWIVGAVVFTAALAGAAALRESYGRDLNFYEAP